MNTKQILIAVGVVGALIAAYFLIYKKMPSKSAKSIKQNLSGYDKFREYLETTLTPEEMRAFRGWKLMIEKTQTTDPEEYKRWMDDAAKGAKAFNIPKEVAHARGLLWQMTQGSNPTLSKDKWEQIHVDSIYLYR